MEKVKHNSLRAWILAAHPKTLTGTITSVTIGGALAYMDGHFQWLPALTCCLLAGLMQIAASFTNDLFDYLKGTDREDRLGPEQACAQGWTPPRAMRSGIIVTVLFACLIGSALPFYAGWELIMVGLLCVFFASLYTTGPYPLSYNGWGNVLVIVFFESAPVGGMYYAQVPTWTSDITVASLICGLLVDILLIVNNYRDREADTRSGKRTVIVRFGEKFGHYLYLMPGVVASPLCSWFFFERYLFATPPPLLYLIPHVFTRRRMVQIHSGKKLNSTLGETSCNMLLMSILPSIRFLIRY